MTELFLVSCFGIVGVLSRYFLNLFATHYVSADFPYSTLLINIVGSFLIGVAYVFTYEKGMMNRELAIGVMTGFLGGFTTFSAFSLESMSLFERGQVMSASIYIGSSVLLGLVSTGAGLRLARLITAM